MSNHAPQISLPSPGVVTGQQIRDLLSVVATLQPFFESRGGEPLLSTPARLEGEAAIAVTTTLIQACARLDAIMADGERWSVEAESQILKTLQKNYEQQYEFLKAQTEGAKQVSRPMFLMKPQLAALADKSFIAYIGDISAHGCGLIGRGMTPEAAFNDFDAAFKREADKQISIDPGSVEPEPEIRPEPKRPKKK